MLEKKKLMLVNKHFIHFTIMFFYKFFPRIDDSHCNRIQSSLCSVHCLDNGYVGKQPVAWKEYCAEFWLKELQKSMVRCTGPAAI